MLIGDFTHTINIWIEELEHYDFNQLLAKPSPNNWSLGQLYMHLIEETSYYIEQIKICVSSNENASEEESPHAKEMFLRNAFPDEQIEGPASNAFIPQPNSKEQLMSGLINLRNAISEIAKSISKTSFGGKTKHPGLHYFDANQWLQFAEMHLRHHLRQKKRIDDFLRLNN